MYLPFIRGKQFDLIALRELVDLMSTSKKIVPIIEPVRWSSTLEKTINKFVEFHVDYCLILNPRNGDFKKGEKQATLINKVLNLDTDANLIYSFIIDNTTSLRQIDKFISENIDGKDLCFVHNQPPTDYQDLLPFMKKHDDQIRFNLEGQDLPRNYQRKLENISTKVVLLSDHFNKQPNNGDYSDYFAYGSETFGDDHLSYEEMGFVGFSDFQTIGKEYIDGGFTPKNVTFHLTHISDNEILKIAHFVSDEVQNPQDVGNKTVEVLHGVTKFITDSQMNTRACNEIVKIAGENKYPGLGYLKKLSISNHIEIIIQFLQTH